MSLGFEIISNIVQRWHALPKRSLRIVLIVTVEFDLAKIATSRFTEVYNNHKY